MAWDYGDSWFSQNPAWAGRGRALKKKPVKRRGRKAKKQDLHGTGALRRGGAFNPSSWFGGGKKVKEKGTTANPTEESRYGGWKRPSRRKVGEMRAETPKQRRLFSNAKKAQKGKRVSFNSGNGPVSFVCKQKNGSLECGPPKPKTPTVPKKFAKEGRRKKLPANEKLFGIF